MGQWILARSWIQCTWPVIACGDFAIFQTDGPTTKPGSKFAEFFSRFILIKN